MIALETDLTTPLAYMWSRTDLERYRWSGLLRPEQALQRANLLMIRPYEPGKIPVVMVHGLISSPLAWIPMLNELLRDPAIQEKYQFMLYMYPTGVPIPIAAAGLRDALSPGQDDVQPRRPRPCVRSHGLARAQHGGDSQPHDGRLQRRPALAALLRPLVRRDPGPEQRPGRAAQAAVFEPLPFVSRVVFLATPHRGSDLSRGVVGRVSAGLINDPDYIQKLLYQLVKDNPDAFDRAVSAACPPASRRSNRTRRS